MDVFQVIVGLILTLILLISAVICFVYWLMCKMFDSIQPVVVQRSSDNNRRIDDDSKATEEKNSLFRHFPQLKGQLAWEELGVFPTPVHSAYLDLPNGRRMSFWMKREDLCSPIYGGNKVRTLQYQIPSCINHLEKNPSAGIYVGGSGGSNQVIATLTHGAQFDLRFHVSYPTADAPDMDNTLNLLSTLSFGPRSMKLWDKFLPQLRGLVQVVTSDQDKIFGMGGNSVGGILGQIGGALELAEQIARGEVPDVDEIYLPLGSGCTTTGLILGVCLARHLNLPAFRSHRFKIVSVMIHYGMAGVNRNTNFMRNWFGNYLCFSPLFGTSRVAPFLQKLTGIDLAPAATKFITEEWEIMDRRGFGGPYGTHSERSALACALDHKIVVNGPCPSWIPNGTPPLPWLCGHFTGKAFAAMLDRLENRTELGDDLKVMLWQTKSNIQPLGKDDEWPQFQELAKKSKVLKKWSDEGKAASVLRPGKVNLDGGNAQDYRPLMKKIG